MATGCDPNSYDLEPDAVPVGLPSHRQRTCITRLTDKEVFDKYPLFPRNQDGGAMEDVDLVHIVILYSLENYDEVVQFVAWLENIKMEANLGECTVQYFDDSIFPPDNVAKVKDIFDRAMRVLLFLTPEFCSNENLSFLSTEGIVQTRLNNDPKCTRLGKMTRSQKQYCMRPVHTMPRDGRSYRVPTGLGDVYGIDYYNRDKNKAYTQRQVVELFKDCIRLYRQREEALTAAVTGSESIYEDFIQQYERKSVSPVSEKNVQYLNMDNLKNASPDDRAQSRQPEQHCTTSQNSLPNDRAYSRQPEQHCIVTSSSSALRSAPCLEHQYDRDHQRDPAQQKIPETVNGIYHLANESTINRGHCIDNINPLTSTNQPQHHLRKTDDSIRALITPRDSSDGFDPCQNQDFYPLTDRLAATVENFPTSVPPAVDTMKETRDSVATECTEQDDNNDIIETRDSIDTENTGLDGYSPSEKNTERTRGQHLITTVCGTSNTSNSSLSTRPHTNSRNVSDTQVQESVDNRNSDTSSSLDVDAGLDSLSLHDKSDSGEVQSLLDDRDGDFGMRNTAEGTQLKNDSQSMKSDLDDQLLKSKYAAQPLMRGTNAESLINDDQPLRDGSDDQPLKDSSDTRTLKNGSDDQPLMTDPSKFQFPLLDKGQISSANFTHFKTETTEINKTSYSDDCSDVLENVLHFSGPSKAHVAKCAATSMSDFPDTDEGITGLAPNVKTERVEFHVHKHYYHHQDKEEKKQEKSIHITGCNVVQIGPHSKILTTNVGQDQTEAQFLGPLKEEESLDESLGTPDSAMTWNNLSTEGRPTWPSDGDCIPKQMKDVDAQESDSDENNETKGQMGEVSHDVNFTGDLDNLPSGYDSSYTVGEEEDLLAKKNTGDVCYSSSTTDMKDYYLDEKLNFEPNDLANEVNKYDIAVTHQDIDSNQSANRPCQSTPSRPEQDFGNGEHKNVEALTRKSKAKVTDNLRFRGGSYMYKHNLQCNYSEVFAVGHINRNVQNMQVMCGESEDDID